MPPPRSILLAGATGLVGRELLARLTADPRCGRLRVWLRRPVAGLTTSPKRSIHQVDFEALPPAPPGLTDACIALGTTIKVAGSKEAFRRVDHDYVVGVAKAARAAGAQHLAVVSAAGADARSRIFYNQVKGEMQDAVAALGYASVTFAQPSLLLGDRTSLAQPVRGNEVWTTRLLGPLFPLVPRSVRPIEASAVAAALVEALFAGRPGVHRLSSGEMQPR